MRTKHKITTFFLGAVLIPFAFVWEAQAVCDTSQLCAGTAPAPCSIAGRWELDDGCDLNFTGRNVAIAGNGTLDIGDGTVTIRAADFTVLAGGFIDGRPGGGSITVFASGDILVQQSQRGIDVVSNSLAGDIILEAGGDIRIQGRLRAHNGTNAAEASGGVIVLRAGGDIDITPTSAVDASGGSFSVGGAIDFTAGGNINIAKDISVSGGDGGTIDMIAGDELVLVGKLQSNGDNGGEGGFIDLTAENNMTIGQAIQGRGSGAGEFGGGDGGDITLTSTTGDVYIRAELTVRSGTPDGGGGSITVTTGGSIEVQPPGTIRAHGDGIESFGGAVELLSDVDVILDGMLDASGGDAGEVDIAAGRDILITDIKIDAAARTAFGIGGTVFIDAAQTMSGHLDIHGTIDASAAQCIDGFCGVGGEINMTACDLTVRPEARLLVDAPGPTATGGENTLAARRQLTVSGTLDATGLQTPGINLLVYPSERQANIAGSTINPPADVLPCTEATCTGDCTLFCQDFCDCGNQAIDQFEQCDTARDGCNVAGGEVCGVVGTGLQCMCIDTCGNGVVDAGEACDTQDGEEEPCLALGYASGSARCEDCARDTSNCSVGTCGDGIIATAGGEVCEPDDLNGATCLSEGFTRGQLACGSNCRDFDTSGCEIGICGDGIPDVGEECDAGLANSNAPNASCRLDCTAQRCGDGIADGQFEEECDDGNTDSGDACLNNCRDARCGDQVLCTAANCTSGPDRGVEECDSSAVCCTSECALRECPDGGVCGDRGSNGCCHPDESCNDDNDCTVDACNNKFDGCSHDLIPGCCTTDAACNDGNPCTEGRCDLTVGPAGRGECEQLPVEGSCDDGDLCTENDACTDGRCVGTPVVCESADPCLRPVGCDPASGCQFELIVGCCSRNGAPCDDGNACTTDDICAGNECGGTDVVCSSDDRCMQATACDPAVGCQFEPIPGCCLQPADCDDGNACTDDTCDAGTATCEFTPLSLRGVDGIDCLLSDDVVRLTDGVNALGAQDNKKKKIAKQLRRFVNKASKKIGKAQSALSNSKKARKRLGQAEKQVNKLLTKLAKHISKGKVDPADGAVLTKQAETIKAAITAAMTQLNAG